MRDLRWRLARRSAMRLPGDAFPERCPAISRPGRRRRCPAPIQPRGGSGWALTEARGGAAAHCAMGLTAPTCVPSLTALAPSAVLLPQHDRIRPGPLAHPHSPLFRGGHAASPAQRHPPEVATLSRRPRLLPLRFAGPALLLLLWHACVQPVATDASLLSADGAACHQLTALLPSAPASLPLGHLGPAASPPGSVLRMRPRFCPSVAQL